MIPDKGRVVGHLGNFKVKEMPEKIMGVWRGMNRSSAVKLHFRPLPPKNEVWVDSYRPMWNQTAKHEVEEKYLEDKKNYSYPKAHRYAENNQNRPKSWVVEHFCGGQR